MLAITSFAASAQNLSDKGRILENECRLAIDARRYDILLAKGQKLLRLGKVNRNKDEEVLGLCHALNARITTHDTTDCSQEIRLLEKAYPETKQTGAPETAAAIAYTLGKYHHFILNAYSNSLQYYLEALEKHRSASDAIGAVADISSIAVINLHIQEPSGWDYAIKAYEEAHKLDHKPSIYITAANIANYLYNEGKNEEAIKYFNEADQTAQGLHYDMENTYLNTFRASLLESSGQPREAENYYRKALRSSPGTTRYDIVYARIKYAMFLKSRKRHSDTIAIMNDAEKLMDDFKMKTFLAQVYPLEAECHEALGNWRNALDYQKKAMELSRQLITEEKEREFAILDLRYRVSEEKRINAAQSLALMRRKRYSELAMAAAILLLLGAAMLWIYHRKRMASFKTIVRHHLEKAESEQRLRCHYERIINERTAPRGSCIAGDKASALFEKLESMMYDDKIYRQCDLSLDKAAQLLETNRTYLSQIVNERAESFTSYVNQFRIKEAVELLSDISNTDSLKAIGLSAGFASPSNFYSLFRKKMGMAPSVFRDNVRNISSESYR